MFGDEPDMPARSSQDAGKQGEPRRPRVAPEAIAQQYAAVKEVDASHPTYLNLTSGFYPQFGHYGDETYRAYCRATDIVGYDLYPVTGWGRPDWVPLILPVTQKLRDLAPARVPVWAILECTTKLQWVSQEHLNQLGHPHGATTPELRAMVWMAIVAGAKGIGYFPHRWDPYKPCDISEELQAEMKRTNRQLKELSPAILGPDVTGKVTVEQAEGEPVRFLVKRSERDSGPYLFMVNASTALARVQLRISGTKALRDLDSGQTMPLESGRRELSFEPLQVRLLNLTPEAGQNGGGYAPAPYRRK
jgi:hypothetical protein